MRYLITCIFLFFQTLVVAQNMDSLWAEYEKYTTNDDTLILSSIYKITKANKFSQPDTCLHLLQRGLEVSENTNYNAYVPYFYEILGDIYWQLTQFQKSIQYYELAVSTYKDLGENVNVGYMHANIGYVYMDLGNYKMALNEMQKALTIAKKEANTDLEVLSHTYLANVYSLLNHFDKAILSYKSALQYYLKNGQTKNAQMCYNNIGTIFFQDNQLDSAEIYFHQSLAMGKKIGDTKNIANGLLNLGSIAYKKQEFEVAKSFYNEALSYNLQRGDESQLFKNYINLSNVYYNLNDFKSSYDYALKAKEIAEKTNNIKAKSSVLATLASYYKRKKDYKKALENFELHVQLEDSILGAEQTKQINELAAKYENERKELEILNLEKDKQLKEVLLSEKEIKLQQEGMYRVGLIIGILFVFIIAVFIFIGYRNKSKSHAIISKQKHVVEEKNREITDSIIYAKRIQEATLPSRNLLMETLKNGFVLYRPKDIVSGDFYWLEQKEDQLFFAAADCTGHGVPGAMVSVVCSNSLSKALLEDNIVVPGELLDKTRELVVQRFAKSGEDVKDGMDIALCSLRFDVNGLKLNDPDTTALLQYAGANNPLWIIRNLEPQTSNFELIEIKPNKQPVGKYFRNEPFTTHVVELKKGDTIYIFTDGFADQFGGPKGKKMMYKPFKELLLSIQNKSMDDQKIILEQHFDNWKGELEQVDDVCVIGVRI